MCASPVVPKVKPTVIAEIDLVAVKHPARLAGWISPDGEYFRVGELYSHARMANEITGLDDGWPVLESAGWVHLTGMGVPETRSGRLTRRQVDTLFDLSCLFPDSVFSTYIGVAIRQD